MTFWQHEHKGLHIISINQIWFKSYYNFSNEAMFSDYLTTWPQITFDLGIWPLTTWRYKGSHIISINQVWFQSKALTIQGFPYCIYDPTLVEIHRSMWKVEPNVNLFSQQIPCNINRPQQQWTKWSLCVFPAMAGDTKRRQAPVPSTPLGKPSIIRKHTLLCAFLSLFSRTYFCVFIKNFK